MDRKAPYDQDRRAGTMIYIFIGPPASGKGTQAKLLAESLQIPFWSTGALLRKMSETRPQLKQTLDRGKIVSEACIREIYAELAQLHPNQVIIDGAMRTAQQVDLVTQYWPAEKIIVIWLEISDDTILKRAKKRLRTDDRFEIVEDRITLYRQHVSSIREALKQHHIRILEIDGNRTIESVHDDIVTKVSQI